MASSSRTLYVGVTSDLRKRVEEHKRGLLSAFTRRYGVNRLVHYEWVHNALLAIRREKEIKGWRREKKVKLISARSPTWRDLADSAAARQTPYS